MHRSILIGIMLTLPVWAGSQEPVSGQKTALTGAVPLAISTEFPLLQWNKSGTIDLTPGRLQLSRITPGSMLEFHHFIQMPSIGDLSKQHLLSLYIYADGHWKNVPATRGNDFLDTVMRSGDSVKLAYRREDNAAPQAFVVFRAVAKTPLLEGYRVIIHYDSARYDGKLNKLVRSRDTADEKFQPIVSNQLLLPPDGIPEFKCRDVSLLGVNTIQYRLIDEANLSGVDSLSGDWTSSDHLVVLPMTVRGRTYRLDLRYIGQPSFSSYTITVQKRWYERTSMLITGGLLSCLTAFAITRLFYRRRLRRERLNREIVEEQLLTLQTRLNPHFIFNALSSIEGLVSCGQNEEANYYLSMFAAIIRETLKNSEGLSISLEEDLSLVDRFLQIEKLRFGFSYCITIGEDVNVSALEVPPMLLQPLIENAVKHGVASLGSLGIITVDLYAKNSNLYVIVKDNGKNACRSVATAGGHGLRFTRERLEKLSKLHPDHPIRFELEHQTDGTLARLIFINLLC